MTSQRVRRYATSRRELDDLRAVIERDLKDAALPGLSPERMFATAYNAALQLAKMALACAGYRVAFGPGHHQTTFEAVKLVGLGRKCAKHADYFDTCRRKRNVLDYDAANVISDTEAKELVQKAAEFRQLIEGWMKQHHPNLAP